MEENRMNEEKMTEEDKREEERRWGEAVCTSVQLDVVTNSKGFNIRYTIYCVIKLNKQKWHILCKYPPKIHGIPPWAAITNNALTYQHTNYTLALFDT